jgi:LAO/AO transport system ATPase
MPDDLFERFRQGDRLALARLLTLAARGACLTSSPGASGNPLCPTGEGDKIPRVVAITGSAGVGKSTLVGKLIELLRQRHLKVAVLACDPQSPVSGGALLGDRFRMPSQPDDGVFIRSLAAAPGHGAVADHLPIMIGLLEQFGFDVILLETVGAGQGDTAVRALADVVVLLLQPEAGDELQWEKAGVLEVADVVAVQKADLPGAESTEAQVRNILGLAANLSVQVLRVSAKTGEGIEKLWEAIAGCPLRRSTSPTNGAELLRLAQQKLAERFKAAAAAHDPALQQILAQLQTGSLDSDAAVAELLRLLTS